MKKRYQYCPASDKTMLKLCVLIFIFFTILKSNCFSQSQFQLVVRDSSNSGVEARSIIQTTDGGYITVGETSANGDMYIVKLNSSGQLGWSKTIGGVGQDLALSVVQTSEGGYAVSGFGSSFGSGVGGPFIVKLTSAGTVEWARVLVDGFGDAAYSIIQTTDGGYAVAISPSEGGFSPDRMIIIKLSSAGILQWSKRFSGNSYARCIRQTTDKGYIVAGVKTSLNEDMFVVKFDSNGSLQWAKTIGGPGDDFAYSVVQTIDDGYAVAGWTSSFGSEKMYIAKLDSSGMLQWTKVLAVNGDRAYSIVQTNDDGYALAGYTGGGGGIGDGMLIIKLSSYGSLQWSRVVDGSLTDYYARSIIQTSDGGYVAAGYGGSPGAKGMYIVKFDNNGNTCANTISHSISVDSGGILGSSFPTVTNISITDTLVTPSTGSLGFVTPICVIGIQPISTEIPASYKLYQNYPNPFNPTTNINFELHKSDLVKLILYDVTGRVISILLNESKNIGSYNLELSARVLNLSSGIYFVKMLTGSGFTKTIKIILIK